MSKKQYIDLTGQKFGRLTAVCFAGVDNEGKAIWNCECECGNKKTVRSYHLRSGRVRSCGCLKKEILTERLKHHPTKGNLKHGGNHTRLYRIWTNMKTRCFNPKNRAYKWYGATGITVCPEWLSFENFQNWAIKSGYKDDLTIERKNPFNDYEPSNCTWIPISEQRKNQRRSEQWQKSS